MDKIEATKQLVEEFLGQLEQKGEVVVEEDKENESIMVKIKIEDPGALIGFHGRALSSFQLLLGLMVHQKLKDWIRVIVDVNDYRQEQSERLTQIALNMAQRVKFSGNPAALPPMTPCERRVIHLALAGYEGVETASEGEGESRRVIIKPKVGAESPVKKEEILRE